VGEGFRGRELLNIFKVLPPMDDVKDMKDMSNASAMSSYRCLKKLC
jgi:hypothetical protein